MDYLVNISSQFPLQGSDEWFKFRDGACTSTQVPIARNFCTKKSRPKLILPAHKFNGNQWTKYGQYMEPIACQKYEFENDDFIFYLKKCPSLGTMD